MKNYQYFLTAIIIMILAYLLIPNEAFTQPPPPPPGPDPPGEGGGPGVPLQGGLIYLISAGIGYAGKYVYSFYKNRKAKK
ncbi:MAG: hypothetical protein KA792_08275 [Bacteroidales bacterium]|nr:hypothetical protein [Bacteroidales bacterium]